MGPNRVVALPPGLDRCGRLPFTRTQTNLIINVRSAFAVVAEAVTNGRTMVVMPIGPAQ
jgi:hypothetical protein